MLEAAFQVLSFTAVMDELRPSTRRMWYSKWTTFKSSSSANLFGVE